MTGTPHLTGPLLERLSEGALTDTELSALGDHLAEGDCSACDEALDAADDDRFDGAVTALSIGDDQILTRHIKDGEVQAGDVAAGEGLTKAIGKARVKARRRDQIEAAALLCHALP